MFAVMLAILLTLLACSPVSGVGADTAADTATDTAAEVTLTQVTDGPAWCLDVEDASLGAFGYPGDHAESAHGVEVFVAPEGGDFSELDGEEALDLPGLFSVGLRAEAGDRYAQITTPLFTITEDALSFSQLSEADHRGVELIVELLAPNGALLAVGKVPALTGGYVPAMPSEGDDDHDDDAETKTNTGNGGTTSTQSSAGVFTRQQLDLSPWRGQSARLRFSQRSVMERVAFFTLLDDLCHQAPSQETAVVPLTAR
jgi:hypothetical protein